MNRKRQFSVGGSVINCTYEGLAGESTEALEGVREAVMSEIGRVYIEALSDTPAGSAVVMSAVCERLGVLYIKLAIVTRELEERSGPSPEDRLQ